MKAITLWQPWASLIACGAKRFETRGWATRYRGPIAIHAAARDPYKIDVAVGTVARMTYALYEHRQETRFWELPLGAIIATAELVDCHKIVISQHRAGVPFIPRVDAFGDNVREWIEGDELLFGDWTPGRYAWELANVKMLPEPIPAKGRQGLWNWEG